MKFLKLGNTIVPESLVPQVGFRKHHLATHFAVITSSTFVLLVVGVVWKVNGRTPTSTPPPGGAKTSWGIELKIVIISYLGGLTKRAKVSNLQLSGGRLGGGVKYKVPGFFLMQGSAFGGSCWYVTILEDFRGNKNQFGGSQDKKYYYNENRE